jgi:GntR family transcriptional regulator/MocR family aminotransferase
LDGSPAGLAVVVQLADGVSDIDVARSALEYGMAPAPLSPWYPDPVDAKAGLLLGVPNLKIDKVDQYCERLKRLIDHVSLSKRS